MKTNIDESLYSRQLYVIGKDAMEKMMNSKILVMGLDGLGQEVVKNLCLTGVSQIYIYDPLPIHKKDFSSGFYFSKKDIGRRRDEALLNKFKGLNEYVTVNLINDISTFEILDLVICCNEQMSEMMRYNRQARRDNCKFIGCQARGVFSQIFCDFGNDFICIDTNGENVITGMINDITSDGVLTVVDDKRHNLEDGDIIKILHKSEYEGVLFKVKGISKSSVQLIRIDGVSILESKEVPFNFVEVYGGDYEQIKRPKIFNFNLMEDTLENPKILSYNFASDNQNLLVHKCFITLSEYVSTHKQLPNEDSFVAHFIKKYNNLFEQEMLIKAFGRMCDTTFMPICSVIGGFVAQEALKSISYKFSPLVQYLYYDAMELISEFDVEKEISPKYERYYSMIKIFGLENTKKIFNLNVFLVGSGAIGCEHLKNMVMCGIGSEGSLYVTDMDSIEQSNLNRQFLFNKGDVGKMKAEVAVEAVKKLNEDIDSTNLHYYNLKVGKETEEIFSDEFYENIDVVANALDNIEARLYIDQRCLLNRKPLVDAGTSGTKGNVQVVVPMYSENYGSSRDPPEKSIPLCTIKNFPHAIEHTIEWAMSEFRFRFHDQIMKIKEYIEDPTQNDEEEDEEPGAENVNVLKKEKISEMAKEAPRNIKECINMGLRLFVRYFHTSIQELLKTFPPDCKTKEGQPFWMPPKRAPVPINFDIRNEIHVTFVRSVANIYKINFGIVEDFLEENVTNEYVTNYIEKELLSFDDFPSTKVDSQNQELINPKKLKPVEFEKDLELNNHVDFVYACSNLRASNYKIKNADKLFVKGIAGRIIPAIATTTSVASGLAVIEMLKLAIKVNNLKYKNSFLNLALPYFGLSDLLEAEKYYYVVENKKYNFNIWNRLEYKDTTLKNIIKAFEIQFQVSVSMITIDNKLIYWDFDKKYEENLEKKVSELADKIKGRKYIIVDISTDNEVDEYPQVVVKC